MQMEFSVKCKKEMHSGLDDLSPNKKIDMISFVGFHWVLIKSELRGLGSNTSFFSHLSLILPYSVCRLIF